MPKTAKIQLPDGRVARFSVPDDYTPEQASAAANEYLKAQPKDDMPSFADVNKGVEFANSPTKLKGRVADALGGHEALLNYATGAVAKPVGDIVGLGQTAYLNARSALGIPDLNADPGKTRRNVIDALTYSPRTQEGADIVASPYNPINIIGRGIHSLGRYAHDVVGGGQDDSSLRGMAANALEEAIPQAIGIYGYKAAEPVANALRTGVSKVTPALSRYGRAFLPVEQRTVNILRDVVGPEKLPDVIRAIEQSRPTIAGEKLDAGHAAVSANSPEFAGLQQVIANEAPGKYGVGGIAGSNEMARLARITRHAGDDTLIPALEKARESVTAPLRTKALASSAKLDANAIAQNLDATISNPVTPTVVKDTLASIKENILSRADDAGSILPDAAYTVRKEIGNTIKVHAKETANWDKRLSSGTERSIQKIIDDAIEKAGAGSMWGEYMREFSSRSKGIESVKNAQKLRSKLRNALGEEETPNAFAKAAAGLKVDLTPGVDVSVNKIIASLKRQAEFERLVSEGHSAALEKLRLEMPNIPSQGMFHPGISVTRSLANRALGGLDRGTMKYLVDNMDNPAKIAELMRKATPAQRAAINKFASENLVKYGAPAASSYRDKEEK